jgi:hypothetical protein
MAGWDNVPHLKEQDINDMLASMKPHQRDARSKGIPSLGAGAIYPVPEEDIKVEPFVIPVHWPRAYGMDVGWKCTAAAWGAHDRDANVWYLYSEHYRGQAEPSVQASAIKARGNWIPGAIDPASRGRAQKDGENLLELYQEQGLLLTKADNAVEAGIYATHEMLSTGQLKVFSTMQNWFKEYRVYRRNDKGLIVKENDHIMDATRYFVMTGRDIAITKPIPRNTKRKSPDWRTM